MNEERTLMVGLDLCDDITQLTCLNPDSGEAIAIGRRVGKDREYECPTVLACNLHTREYYYGSEAYLQSESEHIVLIEHFIDAIIEGRTIQVEDLTLEPVDLVKRYCSKLLSCLNEYFPTQMIQKLVVSLPDMGSPLREVVTGAMDKLGIHEDRLTLQSHEQSYMYYALSQKKELWMNNVGLFEYGPKGMFYSQINIDRRTIPYIVGVRKKDLSQIMDWDMIQGEQEISPEYTFINLANTQLHKQMVTTIYVTGAGFEQDWAGLALKQLCNGRRVFRGKNLFTKGACYAARELAGQGEMEECIFLDEDMIYCNIYTKVYKDAQMQDLCLVKAGVSWRQVDVSLDVIPDKEEEIQITVQNVLRHETKSHLLSLEGFKDRENRMTRFTIRLRFADISHCIVTLKDNGFGEFCPSSNRIWETHITI